MYNISKEDAQKILTVLAEIPAKYSYEAITILQTLSLVEEVVKPKPKNNK